MKKMFAGLAVMLLATGCGASYVPGEHGHYGHNHQGTKNHAEHARNSHHGHHWGHHGHHGHGHTQYDVKVTPFKVQKTRKVAKWRDKQVTYDSFKWVDKQEKYTVTKTRHKEVKEQRTCTHCVYAPKQVEVTDYVTTYTHTETYEDSHHGGHYGHGGHHHGWGWFGHCGHHGSHHTIDCKKNVKEVKHMITVDAWKLVQVPYTVTKIVHEPYQVKMTRTIQVKMPIKLTKTVKEQYWVDEKYEVTYYKVAHTWTTTDYSHSVPSKKAAPTKKAASKPTE